MYETRVQYVIDDDDSAEAAHAPVRPYWGVRPWIVLRSICPVAHLTGEGNVMLSMNRVETWIQL